MVNLTGEVYIPEKRCCLHAPEICQGCTYIFYVTPLCNFSCLHMDVSHGYSLKMLLPRRTNLSEVRCAALWKENQCCPPAASGSPRQEEAADAHQPLCLVFLLWREKGDPPGCGISTVGLFTPPPILTPQLDAGV